MNFKPPAPNGPIRHFDDAYANATSLLEDLLRNKTDAWRAILIADLTGRLRIILWCPKKEWEQGQGHLGQSMASACGPYWSRDVIRGHTDKDHPDTPWQQEAWKRAESIGESGRVRAMQRHRAKSAWFDGPLDPPWPGGGKSCTIALFYSFKGGGPEDDPAGHGFAGDQSNGRTGHFGGTHDTGGQVAVSGLR